MRERFDFRMDEVKAKQFLPSNVGVKLDELTRKVELAADDPLFERIRQIDHDLRNQGLRSNHPEHAQRTRPGVAGLPSDTCRVFPISAECAA